MTHFYGKAAANYLRINSFVFSGINEARCCNWYTYLGLGCDYITLYKQQRHNKCDSNNEQKSRVNCPSLHLYSCVLGGRRRVYSAGCKVSL